MRSDLELGRIHRRRNDHDPRGNSAFPSGRNIAADQQIPDDLGKCPTYLEIYLSPSSHSEHNYQNYCPPGRKYKSTQTFRHKDSLGRVWIGTEVDGYLSATDGRLEELVVQASEDIWNGPDNSTWARTQITGCTPAILRVVYSLLGPQLQNDPDASWVAVCLKWLPSCLIIAALLFIPADLGGETRNNGRYDQFKYHYWGYSKAPVNLHEIQPSRASILSVHRQSSNAISKRPLRPRQLCLLRDEGGIMIVNVSEWEAMYGSIEYLFISYTTEQLSHESREDMDELHRIAESATRTAGVAAYWIACSCMPEEEERVEDVYRISDVVRGAHALVVIIGPPRDLSPDASEMLRQLGSRMWTFPEILLRPSNRPISIYTRGCDPDSFRTLSKRNFATEAWGDAPVSRQLVDHYEASIILSPLELVSLTMLSESWHLDVL